MSNQKIVTETALSALASDIKTALSGKANSNDVYSKSQTYNRTEIDNALDLKADKSELYNVYPTDQESGSIASFTDGADNIPVKSLVSQIVAVESGSGEKSPDNPYTISGFDNGIITRCGKNLINPNSLRQGDYNGTNQLIRVSQNVEDRIKVEYGKTYCAKVNNKTIVKNVLLALTDENNTLIASGLISPFTPTQAQNGLRLALVWAGEYTNVWTQITVDDVKNSNTQLEISNTPTTYEAYKGNTYTFAFGQTVYGGHFDNKGNLVVTHGYIASYNGETINEPWISSMDEYVPNTSPSTGAQVVYPLTNPITLSITSQDIPTLLGENNIFSNTGDVEVDYHADIGLYIDKKISSLAQA